MKSPTPKDVESAVKDIGCSLEKLAREKREEKRREEEKARRGNEQRRKTTEIYRVWLAKQESEAKKSAHVIFEWVNRLLRSDSWEKLASEVGELIGGVDISEDITFEGPSLNPYYSYGVQGHQSLSLDFSGNLYVHNNVKYGKSYKIRNVKDMLDKVQYPIIIKIAETISDGSIWAIIKKRIERRI